MAFADGNKYSAAVDAIHLSRCFPTTQDDKDWVSQAALTSFAASGSRTMTAGVIYWVDKEYRHKGLISSYWLSEKIPRHLITKLIIDIGEYTPEQQKTLKAYKMRTFVMPLNKTRQHIGAIQDDNFELSFYKESGYALRGSLWTDRFRLQLSAFKLNELNAVKIFGPEQIKTLYLDLGQAFVIGASVLLPHRERPKLDKGTGTNIAIKEPSGEIKALKFSNLAVKQKAMYQPTLKH
ncbi:hypothetical protein BC939DRAFT_506315 [Gamsiella multidivaricata]|uniref:uncharacterized protein n=1 Tax=Gamsiella multidivaricata TaxID=101098 RepID=UPI0022209BB8|nr:uncharacterized protein BC939DRAFT_506315 [Gamsiella multidivaricata]KAI7818696.1 hypothetical protein BC939DRAFT_506315 [Gamsiella multidivaricata]